MKTQKRLITIALLICLCLSILPSSASAAEDFGLPCDSTTVTTYYRYWNNGNIKNHGCRSNYHNAIDFGCNAGDPIYAAASGTVSEVGFQSKGFGNYIVISHGSLSTLYGHLKYKPLYGKGAQINKGTVIGYAGSTGNSTGTHLHFELFDPNNLSYVTDPLMRYYRGLTTQQLRIGGNSYRAAKGYQNDSYTKDYVNWLSSSCVSANGDYLAPLYINGGSYCHWTRNYKFKSANYSYAYSGINGQYVGQAYPGDILTVKTVFFNSHMLLASCPWGKGSKDIFLRYEDLFISAPRKADAYADKNSNYVGKIYANDVLRLLEITVDGYAKVLCPWSENGLTINKVVWCRVSDISC